MNDKQKILIVDDRKENLVALRWVLREVDAEIVETISGNDALAATLNNRFAAAILDVQMPEMNGYELAEHLRGEEKTRMIPIVFITAAYADEAHKFMGYEAGGVDYLTKPYSPEVLLGKIKIFLEIDRNRQELEMYRNHLEALVAERTKQLGERMKEIQCLHSVSSLVTERSRSIGDILAAAAGLIPQGWRYPEITCARIVFCGVEFASANFRDTIWKMTADIVISEETVGTLEVCCREERPTLDDGPFLKEERELIGDLARTLGNTIELIQTESLERLARNTLEILNRTNDLTNMIQDILLLTKKGLDFEAVGIRLKEGDDFPYYETNGFPEDFVQPEKYLCAHDEEGKIERDTRGNGLLECMCGDILRGRTDAALPFFTDRGSFWTNSTNDLPALISGKDCQMHTRGRYNGKGYESVALIPLRSGDEIIGLLQLNDRRRNRLTLRMIHFLEDLGSSIGIALRRKKDSDALKEGSARIRSLAANVDSMYLVDRDCTYLFMNEGHLKRFGLALEEVIGRGYGEFHSEEDARQFAELVREVCETGKAITKEHISERDGKHFLRTLTPVMDVNESQGKSQIAVVAKDITEIKSAEEKLLHTMESLAKAVNTTIQVIMSTIEARDPYTAGHQSRVAALGQAIAAEMGISQDKIMGIHMAGSIHDIGKISIPSEILSKSANLSRIEYEMIRQHPGSGFEILKNVVSPWNIAEIVHQHHERMDGSGYPGNLKGEEILIEARILAVADVVEAMASHRPYRPSLGIEAALEEIGKNRGLFYDEAVVDACLRLFREKRFQLAAA